jgi:hypothetical protein
MIHILKIPTEEIIFINKTMGAKKIDMELARFHIDVDQSSLDQQTARYIVTTSGACSHGLTLAEAISVGFLEPDYRASTMLQGYARHCRQGNKNTKVYSWMFLAKNNPVEGRICQVNKLRQSINEAAEESTKATKPAGGREAQRPIFIDIDEDELYEA